jgi:hypothetical protein
LAGVDKRCSLFTIALAKRPFGDPRASPAAMDPGRLTGAMSASPASSSPQERCLVLLATLEVLTPSVVGTVLGPCAGDPARLLEAMSESGLVVRVGEAGGGAMSLKAFVLSARGARAASQLTRQPVRRLLLNQGLATLLTHHIAMSMTVGSLMACLGPSRLGSVWVGRNVYAMLRTSRLKGLYFPDAYVEFAVAAGGDAFLRHLFVEVDLGTESYRQLVRKLQALDAYYLQDHRRLFHTDRLAVAITAPTPGRMLRVREAVCQAEPSVRVLVSLQSNVCSGGALDDWMDCRTRQRTSLLDTY